MDKPQCSGTGGPRPTGTLGAPSLRFGGAKAHPIDHLAGVNGIDLALSSFNHDAVVSATDNPA